MRVMHSQFMINTFHTRNLYKREYSLKKKFKTLFKKIILFFLDLKVNNILLVIVLLLMVKK